MSFGILKKIIYSCFVLMVFQFTQTAAAVAVVKPCFTPAENCTAEIVSEIQQAKKNVYVQAYSFTSEPIAQALVDAQKRGVKVSVLLDKSQAKAKYSSANYLDDQRVWIRIDYLPAIAHNKIIVIDGNTVITGSFNFTKAAQYKNAENVLIINDTALAEKYMRNWFERARVSITRDTYLANKK